MLVAHTGSHEDVSKHSLAVKGCEGDSVQVQCGKQVMVNTIQCAAVSTLEVADWAVVDCTQQLTESGWRECVSMYCTCRSWQPNTTVD